MDKFLNVIGHEKEIEKLKIDLQKDGLSHAYLLVGPSHIGKSLIIEAFAKEILCNCGASEICESCLNFSKGVTLDFMRILDERNVLKIEEIKKINEDLSLSPKGKAKVLFIENIERMTIKASNAFLKILEEPPKNTHILLTCSSLSKILPTIVSRARVLKFLPPNEETTIVFLKNSFPAESLEKIKKAYEISLERIGKAYSFLKNEELYNKYLSLEDTLISILSKKNIADRFLFIESFLLDKKVVKENIQIFYEVLSYLLRKKLVSGDEKSQKEAIKILSNISGDAILLERNVNARLLLENLMLLI